MYFKPLTLSVVVLVTLLSIQHVTSGFGYLGTGPYEKRPKPRFPNKRCPNGFYGIWCNQQCALDNHCKRCQHCVTVKCQQGSCVRSCISGWWGPHCNNECLKDIHCKRCLNCDSVKCNHRSCARVCKANWWGSDCNKKCLQDSHCGACQNCISSHCKHSLCIRKCEANWWGPHCDKRCNDGCRHGSCSDGDGKCDSGCRDGYFGRYCSDECSNNCVSGRCNDKGGTCTGGCKEGYFGSRCNHRCSEVASNCKVCLQGERRCTVCQGGRYGGDCLQHCAEGCSDNRCDMRGSCKCREGYFGTGCEELIRPYTKFWQNGPMKAVTQFAIAKAGCMVDGKLRARNTVFIVSGSGSCIVYKCGRNRVTVAKKKTGCAGGNTCLRGKMTIGGAMFHCKVASRTNRTGRETTINRKLTITEKVVTSYNITKSGCVVDGQLRAFNAVFTLSNPGPCVKFICKKKWVHIAKSKSGCSDGVTCRKGAFTYGCNAIRCSMRTRSNRKLKEIALTVTMAVRSTDSKECN